MKIKTNIILTLSLALLIIHVNSHSAEPPLSLWSMRSLAMGGAGVCTSNNHDALIFNPACLEHLKGNDIALSIPIGINSDLLGTLDDFSNAYTNGGEDGLIEEAINFILRPEKMSIAPRMCPSLSMVTPMLPVGVGMGFYQSVQSSIGKDWDLLTPKYTLNVSADTIFAIGVAKSFQMGGADAYYSEEEKPNTLSVGLTYKYILNRYKIDSKVGIDSIFLFMEDNPDIESLFSIKSGKGSGFDLGTLCNFSNGTMSAGLSLTNILTSITYTDETAIIPMGINAGFAFHPTKKVTLAADLQDVLGKGDIFMKTHLGAEYNLGAITTTPVLYNILSTLTLRCGFNSGYLTYGGKFCIDLALVRLAAEFTYFEEEIGEHASNISTDAWLIALTLGFL